MQKSICSEMNVNNGCRQIAASIGCNIIPWIQSVSCKYCINLKNDGGKRVTKLNIIFDAH